jgi:hypothetical protein
MNEYRQSVRLARFAQADVKSTSKKLPLPLYILMAYLSSLALEGPLRSLLSIIKMENLLYVRDLVAVLIIIRASHFPSMKRGKASGRGIVGGVVYVALCHAVLGLWMGNQIIPVLFAIKIFVAIVFGMAVAEHVKGNENLLVKFLAALFVISAVGVYLNAVVGAFPWEGMDYDTAFGSVKSTKIWWSGGERRLSGFTRANYSAASAIGLSGAFLAAYVEGRILKLSIFLFGMPAIYLTTSKGVIVSFFIITLWSMIESAPKRAKIGAWLAYAFGALAISAPIVSGLISPSPDLVRTVVPSLSSFADRAAVTWPNAFAQVDHWWQWLVGFGVGAVASPLKFGSDFWRFNPIDNMPLYFYLNFGLLGIIYYCCLIRRTVRTYIEVRQVRFGFGLMGAGLLVISYGITTQIMEDPISTIIFGVVVAYGLFPAAAMAKEGRRTL